jgi:hypothetical protein
MTTPGEHAWFQLCNVGDDEFPTCVRDNRSS